MRNFILHILCIFMGLGLVQGFYAQLEMDSLKNRLNEKSLDPNERIETLLDLSDLYLSRNPIKSFSYTKEAIAIAEQTADKILIGKSYRSLGDCYLDKGDHDSSKLYLELALTYIPNDAFTYFFLGQNERLNGDENKCIQYYKFAEKAAIAEADAKSLAIIYYSYSDYYRQNLKDSLAQYYISWSIRILEKSKYKSDLAIAYNIQAEIYRAKGDYTRALDTYIKTADIAYQIVDSNRIGYCLSRMGYIYYMQDLYWEAEIYLTRSLDIAEKVKSRNLKLFTIKALADMYSYQANEKKCKYYAGLCIKTAIEFEDPITEASAYSSLSTMFYNIHEIDSAEFYANKSYKIASKNGNYVSILNAILCKLPIEFDKKEYDQVIVLCNEGIKLAEATQTMEHLIDLYKYQYLAFEKTGNKSEAFDAFVLYKLFEDSLQNDGVSIGLHKSQLEMGYQDKHLADTLVYIENAQKAKQKILLRKQQSTFGVIIGIVIVSLLSIIIFIVWTTSQKRKKLNKSLAELNNDKALLLKEIHHRVKNSLQVVSSLLNLQKLNRGAKNFDELIDESQLKINNIAIVHELLYQSSSFKKINLQQYIDKLTNHIIQTFNDESKPIEIKKDIEAIEISLDKSVPLALIINEIITNCVKYAFVDRPSGIIEIVCKRQDGIVEVRISDNGMGIPVEQLNAANPGIGLTLIQGFIKQLKGELKFGNDNGCFFVFSFPET